MSSSLVQAIKAAMGPLSQRFGLQVAHEVQRGNYTAVLYRRDRVGLRVAIDWSEFRPFLAICELGPDGMETERRADGRRAIFDVDDLLTIRPPPVSPVGKMLSKRDDDVAANLLSEYAAALDASASDVLQGQFDVFAQLDEVVKKREREFR